MARRISSASLTRTNKRLALENAVLAKKSANLEHTIMNSLGGLASGLGVGPGGQAPITSVNPIFQNNQYQPMTLFWTALMYMYKTHGLIQTAIDQPVLDAVRGGLDLSSDQLDQDELGQVEDYLEENAVLDRIVDAFIWARLFGGAALIINTETDSSNPIGDELHGGSLEFYDACRWELTCERRIPANGQYGFYGKKLDASRVITILGKRAPFLIRAQLSDWGMSEIERMVEDFNLFVRGRNVIYEVLEEAKVDVYSLDGFTAQLATANGTGLTTRRIQTMNQIKNFNNALILDKKDEYTQKQLSFGGLSDIMKENRIGIASALRMPMTKLFGIGSTGFSSGEDDIENYNALIESEVRQPMKQVVRKVLKVIVQNLFHEDLDIRFKFKPLRMLSAVDEENIKKSKLDRYTMLYDRLLINSREFGEIIQKDELVPVTIEAAEGLLDDHPQAAMGQPGAPSDERPDSEDGDDKEAGTADDPKGGKIPKADKKAAKAEKAEKPEKANSSMTLRSSRSRGRK